MFPLADTVRSRSFPAVNWLIIIANVLVFVLLERPLSEIALQPFALTYGLVPARLLEGDTSAIVTIFTSMFLHGGWLHGATRVDGPRDSGHIRRQMNDGPGVNRRTPARRHAGEISWYHWRELFVPKCTASARELRMDKEAEKITIIEGPTPVFEQTPETWLPSLAEGPTLPSLALTRLRTFSGPAMVERCWKAWDEGRPVFLEYRDEGGLTQNAEVLAARHTSVAEGDVLMLFVRLD